MGDLGTLLLSTSGFCEWWTEIGLKLEAVSAMQCELRTKTADVPADIKERWEEVEDDYRRYTQNVSPLSAAGVDFSTVSSSSSSKTPTQTHKTQVMITGGDSR